MKKKCNECKRDFSAHLINGLVISVGGKMIRTPMCPICALTTDGTGRKEFTGTMAEAFRQEALAEVKKMEGNK